MLHAFARIKRLSKASHIVSSVYLLKSIRRVTEEWRSWFTEKVLTLWRCWWNFQYVMRSLKYISTPLNIVIWLKHYNSCTLLTQHRQNRRMTWDIKQFFSLLIPLVKIKKSKMILLILKSQSRRLQLSRPKLLLWTISSILWTITLVTQYSEGPIVVTGGLEKLCPKNV